MSLTETLTEIEYPESDGLPMGETDLHIWWMIRIRDQLKHRYRNDHVYVGSNLLVYPVKNDPENFVVPDVFVVHDCDPGMRNTFRIWDEERVPDVVFEITSKSTRKSDEETKPDRYSAMGVRELILFDPTRDYLRPSLQVMRLTDGEFERLEPDAEGRFVSEVLNVTLHRDGDHLVMLDRDTAAPLLTYEEAADAKLAETEQRATAAEAEVKRLRELLRQHGLNE